MHEEAEIDIDRAASTRAKDRETAGLWDLACSGVHRYHGSCTDMHSGALKPSQIWSIVYEYIQRQAPANIHRSVPLVTIGLEICSP